MEYHQYGQVQELFSIIFFEDVVENRIQKLLSKMYI